MREREKANGRREVMGTRGRGRKEGKDAREERESRRHGARMRRAADKERVRKGREKGSEQIERRRAASGERDRDGQGRRVCRMRVARVYLRFSPSCAPHPYSVRRYPSLRHWTQLPGRFASVGVPRFFAPRRSRPP